MAADLPADQLGAEAIRVEPLSPAVGLLIEGVDLQRLNSGAAAMIQDLWQLGGALLFRAQTTPEAAAQRLATVLANGPFTHTDASAHAAAAIIGTHWKMPGAEHAIPPKALVFAPALGSPSPPALMLAGMEAAADTLRMEDPEFLATLSGLHCAHTPDGAEHPLVLHHPQSGEACLYPPPVGGQGFADAERLMDHVAQARFCWRYEWQPGDVLALDSRAVRCRWEETPGSTLAECVVVPGSAPLPPERAGLTGLV